MHCLFRGTLPSSARLRARMARVRRRRQGTETDLPAPSAREESPPELVDVLGAVPGTSPSFLADLAWFGDFLFAEGAGLSLEHCEYAAPGLVWLSYGRRARPAEVREDDGFIGGALFTGDAVRGHVRVACRLVRLACENGVVLPVSEAIGTPVYERFADGGTEGDLEAVLGASTDDRVIQVSRALLARAAAAHAATLEHGMVILGLAGRVRLPPSVRQAFAEEQDATVYGALNAVTRAARDAETLVERESLERLAGEMVIRLYGIPAAAEAPSLQPV